MIEIEDILKKFGGSLRQFIANRVSDSYEREEILQEVFLRIHEKIDTLKDEEKISGWVFQIARNKIIDHYRKKNAGSIRDTDPEMLSESFDEDLNKEFEEDIKEIIRNLPHKYSEALIMTEYEGISQKELSERLGISFSGAKSRVQRARLMVKDLLMQCCHIEFDRYGNVLDYHPVSCCCCSSSKK